MLWSVKYQENLYGLIKSESYKSTGVSFHSSDYLSTNFGNCFFFHSNCNHGNLLSCGNEYSKG